MNKRDFFKLLFGSFTLILLKPKIQEQKFIYVPEFEIYYNPTISLNNVKNRRFDIINKRKQHVPVAQQDRVRVS